MDPSINSGQGPEQTRPEADRPMDEASSTQPDVALQSHALQNQPETPNPRKRLIIGGAVLVVILAAGVAVLGYQNLQARQQVQVTPTPTSASELPPAPPPVPGEPTTSASPAPNGTAETANWKTYTSTQFGFSIKYPEGWSPNTATNGVIFRTSEIEAGLPQIAVDVKENPNSLSSYKWWLESIKGYGDEASLRENTKQEKIIVDGIQAVKLESTSTFEGIPFVTAIVPQDRKVYVIEMSMRKDTILIDQILSTFRFLE